MGLHNGVKVLLEIYYFICMSILPHVCLCTMCMPCALDPEESIGSLGTGVTDDLSCHVVFGNQP